MASDYCIFCGRLFGDDRRRSSEHAAPNWCKKLLPDVGKVQHVQVVESVEGRDEVELGARNPFTTVCEDVCEPCNNGWMQEMEASAEIIMAKLIQGGSRNLRYWRQTIAATWAAKTAMVWESVNLESRTIPLEVLQTLWTTQRLNLRQQVWIGSYAGTQLHHSFRRAAAHVAGPVTGGSDDPNDAHAYLAAITVGPLAFVVFGHLLGVPLEFKLPAEGAAFRRIWPPSIEVLNMPLTETVGDQELEAVVRSLGDPIRHPS
jgi:hypothetical protein